MVVSLSDALQLLQQRTEMQTGIFDPGDRA